MPFQKGKSGNPGGRPKLAEGVREMARAHTPEAIEALVKSLADPKARVSAAAVLLDRGWGKASQPITGKDEEPLGDRDMSNLELAQWIGSILTEQRDASGTDREPAAGEAGGARSEGG